jgi:hypothetical protein
MKCVISIVTCRHKDQKLITPRGTVCGRHTATDGRKTASRLMADVPREDGAAWNNLAGVARMPARGPASTRKGRGGWQPAKKRKQPKAARKKETAPHQEEGTATAAERQQDDKRTNQQPPPPPTRQPPRRTPTRQPPSPPTQHAPTSSIQYPRNRGDVGSKVAEKNPATAGSRPTPTTYRSEWGVILRRSLLFKTWPHPTHPTIPHATHASTSTNPRAAAPRPATGS